MATSPSAQLQADLRSAAAAALHPRRPILHHLNPDTSWLLQLPRPDDDDSGRVYFNILLDPWLAGGQSDVASWFSQQFHATPSAVPSIAAVDHLLHEVESLATNRPPPAESTCLIDAVAISHEFSDHCHRDTLLDLPPSVPVFATATAAKLIQSWRHFTTVHSVAAFDHDWTRATLPPLPGWLAITRLTTPGNMLYYHSALLIVFTPPPPPHGGGGTTSAEAVIYTPHGIAPADLACVPVADPPIATLAFLHGLHDVHLPKAQLNLGAKNGLSAQRLLRARYWIGTHDEVKRGGGLVSWFLGRRVWTVAEALEEEMKGEGEEGTNWLELGNGESRVLV